MRQFGVVTGVAVLGLSAAAVSAASIPVPNFSFESPSVPNVSPYASPNVDNWTKDGNQFSSGEFYNTPDVPPQVDNADGNQLGFIFAVPGVGFHQTLAVTAAVGQSYQLKVGVQGGGGGMPLNTPLQIDLYYVPDDANPSVFIPIASSIYKNDNTSGAISHLSDVVVNVPAVQSTDAWAGKSIGIQLVAIDDPTVTEAGYFDVDNVRLISAPEPASMGLLALGVVALLRRRRR